MKSHGVPQGSSLLLFFHHINDLPKYTDNTANSNKPKLILFPGDANFIFTNPKPSESIKDINVMFTKIKNWFKASLLSQHLKKTSSLHFLTKNVSNFDINIGYKDKQIPNATDF